MQDEGVTTKDLVRPCIHNRPAPSHPPVAIDTVPSPPLFRPPLALPCWRPHCNATSLTVPSRPRVSPCTQMLIETRILFSFLWVDSSFSILSHPLKNRAEVSHLFH